MSKKTYKKDGYFYSDEGSPLKSFSSENDKYFAVIARCGHCGTGYFIPVVFSVYCKDVYSAVDLVRSFARVKRDQKDAILDAFEISRYEYIFIAAIHDRDPYIRGFYGKDDKQVQDRRVLKEHEAEEILNTHKDVSENELKKLLKTKETFDDSLVIEKYFAPVLQGRRLIYPKHINRKELMTEFYSQIVLHQGIPKKNVFYMTIYYQIFGKHNPIGLQYDNGWFVFTDKNGKKHSFSIEDKYMAKLEESGVFERDKQLDVETSPTFNKDDEGSTKIPSRLEKFNTRMKKHKEKISTDTPPQPGE